MDVSNTRPHRTSGPWHRTNLSWRRGGQVPSFWHPFCLILSGVYSWSMFNFRALTLYFRALTSTNLSWRRGQLPYFWHPFCLLLSGVYSWSMFNFPWLLTSLKQIQIIWLKINLTKNKVISRTVYNTQVAIYQTLNKHKPNIIYFNTKNIKNINTYSCTYSSIF